MFFFLCLISTRKPLIFSGMLVHVYTCAPPAYNVKRGYMWVLGYEPGLQRVEQSEGRAFAEGEIITHTKNGESEHMTGRMM